MGGNRLDFLNLAEVSNHWGRNFVICDDTVSLRGVPTLKCSTESVCELTRFVCEEPLNLNFSVSEDSEGKSSDFSLHISEFK